ncbi:F0F1 ATP synthase subunit B [Plastorhodobacter daqingensis]|uniref:ATP synthase subunit b n=1 Tax=Plastorhodobacter daqingensis TaxID=1387281 RepID=A0ABW2UG85_9RHOB
MKKLSLILVAAASPAFAAEGPFLSLYNTDFVVLLGFLVFLAVLAYFKVPQKVLGLLDNRAVSIRSDLAEAKALREEAQSLLASYERKQKEVQEQALRIVANAKDEANRAAEQAKADLQHAIARRLQAAEDQIGSAEQAAVAAVRNQAVNVAIAVAGEVIARKLSAADASKLIDDSIRQVEERLH